MSDATSLAAHLVHGRGPGMVVFVGSIASWARANRNWWITFSPFLIDAPKGCHDRSSSFSCSNDGYTCMDGDGVC